MNLTGSHEHETRDRIMDWVKASRVPSRTSVALNLILLFKISICIYLVSPSGRTV
jgi:hypothetical protein